MHGGRHSGYERSADGTSYTLVSAGEDREFQPESWAGEQGFAGSTSDDCVIVGDKKSATFVRRWKVQP